VCAREYCIYIKYLTAAPVEEENAIPDEHYLRVTRKMPIKVQVCV
jgi:hypothetical protein